MSYIDPPTWIAGAVLPASDLNSYVRDNFRSIMSWGADLASATMISSPSNFGHYLTGTTNVLTIPAPTVAGRVRLVAKGQAAGVPVIIQHLGGNIDLRDNANLGLYVGEALELAWDGTVWTEVGRDLHAVLDFQQITSPISVSATTEAGANVVVTASAITFDGATPIRLDAYTSNADTGAGSQNVTHVLFDSTSIGFFGQDQAPGANRQQIAQYLSRRLVPSNASHTYAWKAFISAGTGSIVAGAGGVGANPPAYLQTSRAI